MSCRLLGTVAEARLAVNQARACGRRVSVVPTMGALHDGHLALVREALRHGDEVVVTVFVNPTQFGPNEDFQRYPRDLARDMEKAASAGATSVFAPSAGEMYPSGEQTRVRVHRIERGLCGASRPGHFEGVATIVAKLFNVLGEGTYVFGRKDYQQLRLIERLAEDLLFPVKVVSHPTVREADGLAQSSRNVFLGAEERARALSIPRALAAASLAFSAGERRVEALLEVVRGALDRAGLVIDYVEIADPETVEPHDHTGETGATALCAVAVRAGSTRLIDNLVLGVDAAPEVSFSPST